MKLFITLSFLLSFSVANAQNFDEKYLAHWIKISGQSSSTKRNNLFVVDGVPHQQVDSTFLKTIAIENIAGIFVLADTSSTFHFTSNVILIRTKRSQTKKEKRKYLAEAKAKFVDNYLGVSSHILDDSKDPVLMIDDKFVHATEAKLVANKLKYNNVYAIATYNTKFDPTYFGQNAKNGMVQIWTYPKNK